MNSKRRNLKRAETGEGPITTFDLETVRALEPYADAMPIQAIGKVSELADQPPLIAASIAVAVSGLALGNPRLARTGLRMLASHALATGMKTVLKRNVDRQRPRQVEKDGEHEVTKGTSDDSEDQSFPSGHSAGAVAVARAITREYSAAAPAAYLAAGLASAVQVPRKAHFPSDVIVGVAIGLASEAVLALLTRGLGVGRVRTAAH